MKLRHAGYLHAEIKAMDVEEVVELYEVVRYFEEREQERREWLAAQTL